MAKITGNEHPPIWVTPTPPLPEAKLAKARLLRTGHKAEVCNVQNETPSPDDAKEAAKECAQRLDRLVAIFRTEGRQPGDWSGALCFEVEDDEIERVRPTPDMDLLLGYLDSNGNLVSSSQKADQI